MVMFPLKYACIPYLPHIFLKLSDSPLVYGTTTCPIMVLVVVVVFAVLLVLLLCSSKSLFAGVISGPMPWSSVVWLALLF